MQRRALTSIDTFHTSLIIAQKNVLQLILLTFKTSLIIAQKNVIQLILLRLHKLLHKKMYFN